MHAMDPHIYPVYHRACSRGRAPRSNTTSPALAGRARSLADRVGFEPTVPCSTTVFETVPFGRSGTCPFVNLAGQRVGSQVRFAAKKAFSICEHSSFMTPPSTGGL
jgi:hypothetical protein